MLHSGTWESQKAICLATLWYAEPGIESTGLIGVSDLCTFACP